MCRRSTVNGFTSKELYDEPPLFDTAKQNQFHFVNYRLMPSTHSTIVNLDRMCLIHSIVKGRKIDVYTILHQKITNCAARQTEILVFPPLVMLQCQQKGIVPRDDEEVLKNKGPINEVPIERMTRGKDTPTMKEVETNKTRKGKTKIENKGTNLTVETSLLRKIKDIEKLGNSISNKQIKLSVTIEDIDRSQNLFYAYTRAYNNFIVATLRQLSPTPFLEFPVLPPIIREYEPSSEKDDQGD
ncbi:hypothetical protein PVK06_039968 [Gossypium arboreum]|uniref:Uncharacterized protein n=1 Tax=Gossypium arboreum TaxID=29729 RepID=A0ABR0N480_GOSAR|nr:hypothetical protein PVK06_039968 [Gossypium arboreum]